MLGVFFSFRFCFAQSSRVRMDQILRHPRVVVCTSADSSFKNMCIANTYIYIYINKHDK